MWRDTWNSVLLKEWVIVVFKANSTIFPLYNGENKLIINEMMMKSALYQTNMLSLIFIVLAHWNNSLRADMSLHSDTLFWFRANQSLLFPLNVVCLAEKQQKPILVFGLTRPWLEPTIYHTWGEHANHYATDVVCILLVISLFIIGNYIVYYW